MLDTAATMVRMRALDTKLIGVRGKRMRAVSRFQGLVERYRSHGTDHAIPNHNPSLTLSRRSKLTLAGVFTFGTAVFSTAGIQAIQAADTGNTNDGSQPAATTPAGQASSSLTDTGSAGAADASGQQSTHATSISTDTTTTTDSNGQPSTQVTVNGQPVNVPANGSVHKTTSSGNQQTDISVSQSTTGTNHTSTHVNINGHSTTTVNEEDSESSQ